MDWTRKYDLDESSLVQSKLLAFFLRSLESRRTLRHGQAIHFWYLTRIICDHNPGMLVERAHGAAAGPILRGKRRTEAP